MIRLIAILCCFSAAPIFAQTGDGEAFSLQLDLQGSGLIGITPTVEVGPIPYVSLTNQNTSATQAQTAVNLNLGIFESTASGNVASVSTAYNATPGQLAHTSSAQLNDVDITVETLLNMNVLTITASALTSDASVSGPCNPSGTGNLIEAGMASTSNLNVQVLGQTVTAALTTTTETTIDIGSIGTLGTLGVGGTLILNRVQINDDDVGSGSVTAIALDLTLNLSAAVVGAGNAAQIHIQVSESTATRMCNGLPVELQGFSIE